MRSSIVLWMAFLLSVNVWAQEGEIPPPPPRDLSNVNLIDYIKEVQIWGKDGNDMDLSFWLPNNYWEIALKDNPDVPREVIDQLSLAFEDYVVICALSMKVSNSGKTDFIDEQAIFNSMSIAVGEKKYRPLTEDAIGEEAKMVTEMIRPMFAQMLGQMGEGMYFYFFKIQDENGKNLIDVYSDGQFVVHHSDKSFEYSLPISSLLPNKICPEDGGFMKGNWSFCPFHGTALKK